MGIPVRVKASTMRNMQVRKKSVFQSTPQDFVHRLYLGAYR